MSYLGQPPRFGDYPVKTLTGNGSLTSFNLDHSVPSDASIIVTIDGVRQHVGSYSAAGTAVLDFGAGNAPANLASIEVVHLGLEATLNTPADLSVTTGKIVDDAVTADKLANSINTEIAANTAKVTNATHTGDVTGATALTIAADAVDIPMLSATGTASATTFLRGDNAWSTVDSLPTQTSKDGYTLVTDGTNASWEPKANRNVVINGNFDIWQRGSSFTSASYYQDYADRWMGDAHNSGGNTISQQTATASEPFNKFLRFQRDSGQSVTGARRVGTVFESVDSWPLAGKEVTLSWYCRKGANYGGSNDILAANLFTGTGTDETMSNGLGSAWTGFATGSTNATMTTSWQRFTHTATLSATATQVGINFVTSAATGTAGAADYFDISGVQLEIGGIATPLEQLPIVDILARCQRYYEKVTNGSVGGTYSGSHFVTQFQWMTTKRTTPSLAQGGVLTITRPGLADYTQSSTSMSINGAGRNDTMGAQLHFGNFGSLANQEPHGININTTFYIKCDAEL